MNRRFLSWLTAGAGAMLVVCAMLVHNQLADAFARRDQAAAPLVPSGAVDLTQTAGGDTIALRGSPDEFGTYTFTVAVQDAKGGPLENATVEMVLTMPDMQMAALRIPLAAIGPAAPGSYGAQGVLPAGRWQAVVQVLAQGAMQPVQATFRFSAT